MPAGDKDRARRQFWTDKAKQKKDRIDRYRRRQEYLRECKEIEDKLNKKLKEQPTLPSPLRAESTPHPLSSAKQPDGDANNPIPSLHTMLDTAMNHLENSQVAIGAIPGAHQTLQGSTKEESKPEPLSIADANSTKPNVRKKQVVAEWQRHKMKQRKDTLTRLMVWIICVFVIMGSLVALAIISWWSHASITNNLRPFPFVGDTEKAALSAKQQSLEDPPLPHAPLL